MLDHLSPDHLAVVVAELLDLDGADVALPDLLFADLIEAHLAPPFARKMLGLRRPDEQPSRDREHLDERRLAHALVRRVIRLRAVGHVETAKALRRERISVA